jgi:NADH-ubiquinone oxidoreductase chain 5
LFGGLVLLISSLVVFYTWAYIEGELKFRGFLILVFIFILSMLFLILSPNLLSVLLGWDGLGLVSYCLVIYYESEKTSNSGVLTILSNRLGDLFFLVGICWCLNYGSFNFSYLGGGLGDSYLLVVFLCVIVAGMTRGAQIPFSAWLPAAIAAPTPISSLVHSSTLVTAGVYLLIRFSGVLNFNFILLLLSLLTLLISGVSAIYEADLRKIIALSTLSQLGLMILTLSLGFEELAFFHLISHALFKSLLFLCAGVYIHIWGDVQDTRKIRGVLARGPLSSVFFISSSLSLCG